MIKAKAVISVPFYNEIRFLEETLECLKAVPADVPVRFFLCDNQSTDGSTDIAAKFARSDNRFVHHIQKENLGATGNFKFAFENSQSDYFMWLGAHDTIDPSYPAAAIKAFENHPQASYAAAEPYGFKDTPAQSALMTEGKYTGFHGDNLTRYLQSVAMLSNCTIVNSMFRRSCVKNYSWRHTISWDHVFISHLLYSGPVHYTAGHKYYRRFFDDHAQSREEKLAGADEKKKALPRWDFLDFYVEDFRGLYDGPPNLEDYVCKKILEILEKRFTFQAFSTAV